jgi:hypothetical protein
MSSAVNESPYIRFVRNKRPEPDPNYIYELNVLRAMVRQEDYQGDIGWGGTWTKERYQRLRDKHPEALMAFEAEIRWEREEQQLRRETFERYRDSPYLEEQGRAYPENPDKERYLEKIGRLRYLMILKKLGYVDRMIAMAFTNLRNAYPEAHEAFEKELRASHTV